MPRPSNHYCVLDSNTRECVDITVLEDISNFTAYRSIYPDRELASDHTGEIGWTWTGSQWQKPDPNAGKSLEQIAKEKRLTRDQLLRRTVDSISPVRWNAMSEEEKKIAQDYRQALLDITDDPNWPLNPNWPVVPSILL